MTNDKITQPVEIDEAELENTSGSLPAVQKAREAAFRAKGDVQGDGVRDLLIFNANGAG